MKRVLVTPLDWGLGHASRCVPIIKALVSNRCEVILAGAGASMGLLRAEFPALTTVEVPAYNPVYPRNGSMMTATMLYQLPHFLRTIGEEHRVVERLVRDQKIDLVISDNRYGAWSASAISIFITHQSNIMMPLRFGWLQGVVRNLNHRYINRFSRCWVPDYPAGQRLAGELADVRSGRIKIPIDFIGALSRFTRRTNGQHKYDIAVILSGPEPQRTILEEMIMPKLERSRLRYFVVRGVFTQSPCRGENVADFLAGDELEELIEASDTILARSGYSTVMDLAVMGKKAILIPTPGQPEQEYLARRMMEQRMAFSMPQATFDLDTALREVKGYKGISKGHMPDNHLLHQAIARVLS